MASSIVEELWRSSRKFMLLAALEQCFIYNFSATKKNKNKNKIVEVIEICDHRLVWLEECINFNGSSCHFPLERYLGSEGPLKSVFCLDSSMGQDSCDNLRRR